MGLHGLRLERHARRRRAPACGAGILALLLRAAVAPAAVYTVPDDFPTVQAGLDTAVAGDTVRVRQQATPYSEKIAFPRSGDAGAGFITLEAFPGERPVLDGTGVPGSDMVRIENRSYVKLIGFEIRNNLDVRDGSGVRVLGAGSSIEIRDNQIHDIRGRDAMGITVYGTEAAPIANLTIDGNEIFDCEPFRSEALTLNGNVTDFAVTNNVVRDVNNIGIDFIGGETDIQPDLTKVARNGVCRGNTVIRARESGGGYAAGIYVDGGRNIVIENNVVTESDVGIEVGSEHAGIVADGMVVRDNLFYANEKAGMAFGGYQASVGRTKNSLFLNNTCYRNDTLGAGFGELWIQYAEDNTVRNNIFVSTAQNRLVVSEGGNVNNVLDYNLFFTDAGAGAAQFIWQGTSYAGFAAYRAGTGQDANSLFADPQFVGAGDFHLASGSPAVDAGDPAFVPAPGEVDLDGAARVNGGRVDIGADEATCGDTVVDPGEQCDDGNAVDGDGCDSNCTVTGCGNRIVTAGEQCDDGNTAAGDCCAAGCLFEANGSPCSDGSACTVSDGCDGAGACIGTAAPETPCRGVPSRKSTLTLRDAADDDADRLSWRWTRGDATTLAEWGDPTGADSYTLCIFDASVSPQPVLAATAPPGSSWRATSSGFAYRSTSKLPDGILVEKLKAGGAQQAKITVKGRGPALDVPALGALVPPLTVQLKRSSGGCWGAVFSSPDEQDAGRVKARSD